MITNVYDPAAIQHEFTRKCLRFFYEDIPEDEYDGSEDDLREYAANINESFGYDLDQRIAALEAERDGLLEACADALEWINDFGMHSPVRFGGEAELAIKLTKALGDEQDDRPD